MPIPPRCSITEFVNSNCTAFVASFQWTSTLSFTEPSPRPSPSPSVDLRSICALVQIFYCFLCTSQNSFSLAEHSCAPVKVSFHWLLRFSALVVNYSIRVTCHVFQRKLFVERKIVYWLISVPFIDPFPCLPTQKSFGLLKASRSLCSSSLCRKKPLESSESFNRTIAEVKQTTMFSVMVDKAMDISNRRKPSFVLRYVDSSKNIREEFSGVRHCWEETTGNTIKELITNSVRDLGLTRQRSILWWCWETWLAGTLVY